MAASTVEFTNCRKKWVWPKKDEPPRLEEICLGWVITKHPLPPTA
ncbi:hypothetical protein [Streptomyces sp. ISL-98]|nr:hypothetical protein [Streptomyces sp. ISL-98]